MRSLWLGMKREVNDDRLNRVLGVRSIGDWRMTARVGLKREMTGMVTCIV